MQAYGFFNGRYQCLFKPKVCYPMQSKEHRISINCKGLKESKGFGSGSGKNMGSNPAKKVAFGGGKPRRAVTVKEDSSHVKKILKEVEQGKLDIDPEVATKGKVDFVQVESWGSEALENLKMKSFSPSFTSLDQDAPFYEQLVRRLQLFEAKGDITVVQVKPLPPFEKWLFGEHNYLQFLMDQGAVYTAFENAISSIKQSRCSSPDESTHGGAAKAVSIFDKDLGLSRSEALKSDIESLSSIMTSKCVNQVIELPKVTTQAVAYAKYVERLGKIASFGEKWKEACLCLLSHIFVVHVAHLTTGMRIGAKAVDSLPSLIEGKAISFYRDYQQQVNDPLKVFMTAINKAGDFINSEDDREQVMTELPKAIQKTSLLLAVLAVD